MAELVKTSTRPKAVFPQWPIQRAAGRASCSLRSLLSQPAALSARCCSLRSGERASPLSRQLSRLSPLLSPSSRAQSGQRAQPGNNSLFQEFRAETFGGSWTENVCVAGLWVLDCRDGWPDIADRRVIPGYTWRRLVIPGGTLIQLEIPGET